MAVPETRVGARVRTMAVRGRWTPELGDQVSAALRMCLAGAPTAVLDGDAIVLAYRTRSGDGDAVLLARSPIDDGVPLYRKRAR